MHPTPGGLQAEVCTIICFGAPYCHCLWFNANAGRTTEEWFPFGFYYYFCFGLEFMNSRFRGDLLHEIFIGHFPLPLCFLRGSSFQCVSSSFLWTWIERCDSIIRPFAHSMWIRILVSRQQQTIRKTKNTFWWEWFFFFHSVSLSLCWK